MNTFKKAITINRVSTEEQARDDRNSLPAQVRDNRKYCEEKKLEIIGEYTFDESASASKRKKFEEAIAVIEKAEETIALVVDRVDRFQRSFRESVRFDELRKDGKVEIHFREQGLTIHRNSSAYELMSWDMWVVFARSYVLTLSANVKKGIKGKLEKGEFPGYVPTGYKNGSRENGDGRFTREIQVDEEKAKYVVKLFELYATGRYTAEQLAEVMRGSKFRLKAKKIRMNGKLVENGFREITKTDVLNILHNPFYYGEFYWHDPETGERRLWNNKGTYPTLISKSLYEQVQKIIDDSNTRVNGNGKNVFKFQKLLECSFCGSTLTPEEMSRTYKDPDSAEAKSKIYYHCSNGRSAVDPGYYERKFGTDHSGVYTAKKGKKKGQKIVACPQRWWKEEEIEAMVLEEFDIMHYDDSVLDSLKKILHADHEERIALADEQIKVLERRYKKNEELIRAFTQKFVTVKNKQLEEDMMQEYSRLKKEQEDLRDGMKIYEETKMIDTDKTIDTMKLCCNLRKHYESLDFEKQRELLALCFSKIVARKGTWRIDGGKGKRVKTASLYPVYNEPFATLRSIKVDELIAQEEDERKRALKLTKNKEIEASLFP